MCVHNVTLEVECVPAERLPKMVESCVCFQVDELYEAFCIQNRLREGAIQMKQAFSSSPSTKGTKESIAEVNRCYKEYTEVLELNDSLTVFGIWVKYIEMSFLMKTVIWRETSLKGLGGVYGNDLIMGQFEARGVNESRRI